MELVMSRRRKMTSMAFAGAAPTTAYSWIGQGTYACHMKQNGSEPATFSNADHVLSVGKRSSSPLTITSATGCDGLYAVGDPDDARRSHVR
jgi:hypothetical protein